MRAGNIVAAVAAASTPFIATAQAQFERREFRRGSRSRRISAHAHRTPAWAPRAPTKRRAAECRAIRGPDRRA
jgi:hypothetical protein